MYLNKINAAITGLLIFSFFTSFSQNDFQGKAYYFSKTTVDISNFGGGQLSEERKKQIADRMKSALEKTYVLTFNRSESIYDEEEKLDAPGQDGGNRFRFLNAAGGGGLLYKNVKDQKILQEQEFLGKQFLVVDSLPKLDWQLGAETKTIGQYVCFKATAVKKIEGFDISNFARGARNMNTTETPKDSTNTAKSEQAVEALKEMIVTAWYTPQIPINQGPGTYWGLPGLILEINADRTTILCSKIVLNLANKEEMKIPSKGKEVTKEEYNTIVKEKTDEMREQRGSGRRNF